MKTRATHGTTPLQRVRDGLARRARAGYALALAVALGLAPALLPAGAEAAPGDLDTTFDADGKQTTNFYGRLDKAYAVAVQTDGKIVVAGDLLNTATGAGDFALARYNADGSLDATFGGDGRVSTDFGGGAGGDDHAYGVVVQADGKIVAAGAAFNGTTNYDFALARYNTDGSLDTSFSGDGKVMTDIPAAAGPNQSNYGHAVAIQPGGAKIVVAGYTNGGNNGSDDFAVARYNASDGSLDTSFDTDGMRTVNIRATGSNSSWDNAYGVVVEADNQIVMAGHADGSDGSATGQDFALVRLNESGSFDTAVGGNGRRTATFGTGNTTDGGRAIALDGSGNVVVAGWTSAGDNSTYDFAVARYSAAALTLDTAFSGDGKQTVSFDDLANSVLNSAEARGVAFSGNDIIVAGVSAIFSSSSDFAVARLTSNGSLDTSFDSDGKQTVDFFGAADEANAMALTADGSAVVAGLTNTPAHTKGIDFGVAQISPSGSLDTDFSGDGRQNTDFHTSAEDATALAVQPDGKAVVAGFVLSEQGDYDFAVARYNTDGSLDATFGDDGTVRTNLHPTSAVHDQAYAVAVQPDGRIVVAGHSNFDFALVRYNADGSLDTSFDADGIVTTAASQVSGNDDTARAVLVQPDGRIVVAGYAMAGTSVVHYNFAAARYNSDGLLDANFNPAGAVVDGSAVPGLMRINASSGQQHDQAYALRRQPDGKLVLAGYASLSTQDFAVVRLNSDGSADTTFDSDGIVTRDLGSSTDTAYGVAIQVDGRIVAVGTNNAQDFALARFNPNGSRDNNTGSDSTPGDFFGASGAGGGVVTTDFNGSGDEAFAVRVTSGGKLVVAGYAIDAVTGFRDFALARYNTDGSLDTNADADPALHFSTDGKLTTDFTGSHDQAAALAMPADGSILVAGTAGAFTGDTDFALARYLRSESDLVLKSDDLSGSVVEGSTGSFDIRVRNAGPSEAHNVTFTATIPAGLTFSSADTTAGSCSELGGTVTCDLGTLADNAEATVTIEAVGSTVGTHTLNTSASSDEFDWIESNNTRPYKVTVVELVSLTLSEATTVGGCGTPTGVVRLSGDAPAGGAIVTLSSNNAAASVPATVTVQGGSTQATFPITPNPVSSGVQATITAALGGDSYNQTLTVRSGRITTFTADDTTPPLNSSATGTVTINCVAPAGGLTIPLASNRPKVASVPSSVVIQAGQSSANFQITTGSVVGQAVISATHNGRAMYVRLNVGP